MERAAAVRLWRNSDNHSIHSGHSSDSSHSFGALRKHNNNKAPSIAGRSKVSSGSGSSRGKRLSLLQGFKRGRRPSISELQHYEGGSSDDESHDVHETVHETVRYTWKTLRSASTDIVQALCCVFLWVEIPYHASFGLRRDGSVHVGALYIAAYVADTLMCLCLCARLARIWRATKGNDVDPLSIKLEVISQGGSLILAAPFDLLLWAIGRPTMVPWARFAHMLRVPVLLAQGFHRLDRSPFVPFVVSRAMRTSTYLVLFVHTLTCALWHFSRRDDAKTYNEGYWVTAGGADADAINGTGGGAEETSAPYIRTTYFSLLSFSSVLSEDIAVDRSSGTGTTLEYAVGIILTFSVNLVFLYVRAGHRGSRWHLRARTLANTGASVHSLFVTHCCGARASLCVCSTGGGQLHLDRAAHLPED